MTMLDSTVLAVALYVLGALLMLLTEYEFYLLHGQGTHRRWMLAVRALCWPAVSAYRGLEFLGYIWRFRSTESGFVLSPMEEREMREHRDAPPELDDEPIAVKLQKLRGDTIVETEEDDGSVTFERWMGLDDSGV